MQKIQTLKAALGLHQNQREWQKHPLRRFVGGCWGREGGRGLGSRRPEEREGEERKEVAPGREGEGEEIGGAEKERGGTSRREERRESKEEGGTKGQGSEGVAPEEGQRREVALFSSRVSPSVASVVL